MSMPFQDRLSGYSPTLLLNLGSALSMSVLAMSSRNFIYNFPLFLFGLVAHEISSTPELLRQFLNLLFWSSIFDVLALLSTYEGTIVKLIAFIVLLLKLPIGVTSSAVLRERGGQFSVGGWVPGRSGGQGGQSNWTMPSMPSMPGGFGGSTTTPHGNTGSMPAPGGGATAFPASGGYRLGGEDDSGSGSGGPPPAPPPGRNGYSSIA